MPRLICSLNDMRTCTMFLFAVILCYYDLDFKICVNDQKRKDIIPLACLLLHLSVV